MAEDTGIYDGRWEERYNSVRQELDTTKANLSKASVENAENRAMHHRIIQMAIDDGWMGDHNSNVEDAVKFLSGRERKVTTPKIHYTDHITVGKPSPVYDAVEVDTLLTSLGYTVNKD